MTLPSFLFHVTGMTLCSDFPVILFQWLWLKATQLCTLNEFLQRAPNDNRTSLGLSSCSLIILTGFVSIDHETIKHFFVGSWLCVSSFPRHERVAHTEHFHIPQSVAEQATGDLVANEVPLKQSCSKIEQYG